MAKRQATTGSDETYMDGVAEAIKAAMPALDETDQRIATAIHRLMSGAEPVEPGAVARAAGVSVDRVTEKLHLWPGVFRDEDGRLVGFLGHAIEKLEPEHRMVAGDKTTYQGSAPGEPKPPVEAAILGIGAAEVETAGSKLDSLALDGLHQ